MSLPHSVVRLVRPAIAQQVGCGSTLRVGLGLEALDNVGDVGQARLSPAGGANRHPGSNGGWLSWRSVPGNVGPVTYGPIAFGLLTQ